MAEDPPEEDLFSTGSPCTSTLSASGGSSDDVSDDLPALSPRGSACGTGSGDGEDAVHFSDGAPGAPASPAAPPSDFGKDPLTQAHARGDVTDREMGKADKSEGRKRRRVEGEENKDTGGQGRLDNEAGARLQKRVRR